MTGTKNICIPIGKNHMQFHSSMNKSIFILRLCLIGDCSSFTAARKQKQGTIKNCSRSTWCACQNGIYMGIRHYNQWIQIWKSNWPERSWDHLCTGITVLHIAITVRNLTTSGEPDSIALSSSTSVYKKETTYKSKADLRKWSNILDGDCTRLKHNISLQFWLDMVILYCCVNFENNCQLIKQVTSNAINYLMT